MQRYVIIINGKGGVGKDTLCSFAENHYPIKNISSITPIKDIAKAGGWNGEKDASSRKLLSDLKRVFTDYNDLPLNYMINAYKNFLSSSDRILFLQIREAEEIERAKKKITACPCLTLLIVRQHQDRHKWGNASDDQVENYHYDYIYHNDKKIDEAESDFVDFLSEITGIIPEK